MSVAILNGPTVMQFVEDGEAFNKCADDHFKSLDVNGDGVLSRSELRKGFDSLLSMELHDSRVEEDLNNLYDIVFQKFDSDHSGTVDIDEFRCEMKQIMLAVAQGMGSLPVQVVLDNDSFLMRAVEHESSAKIQVNN